MGAEAFDRGNFSITAWRNPSFTCVEASYRRAGHGDASVWSALAHTLTHTHTHTRTQTFNVEYMYIYMHGTQPHRQQSQTFKFVGL